MLAKPKNTSQLDFFITFEYPLNHDHPLFQLAKAIQWQVFDDAFFKTLQSDTRQAREANPVDGIVISLKAIAQFK